MPGEETLDVSQDTQSDQPVADASQAAPAEEELSESDQFDSAFIDEEPEEAAEKPQVKAEAKPEDKGKEPEEEEEEKEEVGEEKKADEEDLDADTKRGRDLLTAEKERAEADEKAREEEEEKEKAKAASAPPADLHFLRATPDLQKIVAPYFSPDLLKGEIKIGDETIDLGKYVEDNPEIPLLIGAGAYNMLQDLVNKRVILPASGVKTIVDAVHERIDSVQFDLALYRMLPAEVDPAELVKTAEFKDWHKKSSDEVKALFRSDQPTDHAKGLKRFLRETGKEIETKRAAVKETATKRKEAHKDLFRKEKTGRSPSPSTATEAELDFDAGFSEG